MQANRARFRRFLLFGYDDEAVFIKNPPDSVGKAGDRDRTDDIQLGKLTFYH